MITNFTFTDALNELFDKVRNLDIASLELNDSANEAGLKFQSKIVEQLSKFVETR